MPNEGRSFAPNIISLKGDGAHNANIESKNRKNNRAITALHFFHICKMRKKKKAINSSMSWR
jgi:hypothetical protein